MPETLHCSDLQETKIHMNFERLPNWNAFAPRAGFDALRGSGGGRSGREFCMKLRASGHRLKHEVKLHLVRQIARGKLTFDASILLHLRRNSIRYRWNFRFSDRIHFRLRMLLSLRWNGNLCNWNAFEMERLGFAFEIIRFSWWTWLLFAFQNKSFAFLL